MQKKPVIIVTVIVVVLVALFAIRSANKETVTPSTPKINTPSADEISYIDPGARFTFVHPKSVAVVGPAPSVTRNWRANATTSGYLLASMVVPKTFMPSTNFSDARLTIGVSSDSTELSSVGCPSMGTVSKIPGGATAPTINDQTYTKLVSVDAGAGNFYETTGFYTIRDGDCYAIEYVIHSTNIGNYAPSQGIKEFDKTKIKNLLQGIVDTFVFTINSD